MSRPSSLVNMCKRLGCLSWIRLREVADEIHSWRGQLVFPGVVGQRSKCERNTFEKRETRYKYVSIAINHERNGLNGAQWPRLGEKFVNPPPFDLAGSYTDSNAGPPVRSDRQICRAGPGLGEDSQDFFLVFFLRSSLSFLFLFDPRFGEAYLASCSAGNEGMALKNYPWRFPFNSPTFPTEHQKFI